MTTETTVVKLPRGHLKCNMCRATTSAKNGDWFFSKDSHDQQIFLCKKCELDLKETYTRAIPIK